MVYTWWKKKQELIYDDLDIFTLERVRFGWEWSICEWNQTLHIWLSRKGRKEIILSSFCGRVLESRWRKIFFTFVFPFEEKKDYLVWSIMAAWKKWRFSNNPFSFLWMILSRVSWIYDSNFKCFKVKFAVTWIVTIQRRLFHRLENLLVLIQSSEIHRAAQTNGVNITDTLDIVASFM